MIKRILEPLIKRYLSIFGGLLITGAKDVGKTEISKFFSKMIWKLDDAETYDIVKNDYRKILEGKQPILIDEWQLIPSVWNTVRNEIDRINKTGLFILTGSSSLLDKNIINKLHSGAGRLCKIKMYTLTATEIGFSKKNISFQDLFKGNLKIKKIYNSYTFKNYVELLCKGGRPRVVDKTCTNAMISNAGYLDEISELSDKVTGIQQNSFLKVVSSLARNISQDVTYETLSKDSGLINDVVYKYYEYCKKIFIIEPLETWNVHLRSSASLRVKPKIHFSDTSIAVTAIKGTVEKFIEEPKDFGLFFEDLVIHDLRAYVSISNDFISYYRDSQGLEIDCIIEKRDGSWIAIEVKTNDDDLIEHAANNLKLLLDKLPLKKQSMNKGLYIITTKNISYTREDGINVISFADLWFDIDDFKIA